MLQTIRDRMGVLSAIVIGSALLAFILGDCAGNGSSMMRSKQNEIGEAAGNIISIQEYQEKVAEISNIYKMQSRSGSLDENTINQIREQAWQSMVQTYIMSDLYEELAIAVTSDEMLELVQGEDPHPIIKSMFADPRTGVLNREALVGFLKNIYNSQNTQEIAYWNFMQTQIKSSREQQQYAAMVSKGLYVTDAEVTKAEADRNTLFDIELVTKSYNTVVDSTVTITDSELKSYFNAHKEDFKQVGSRTLDYVVFPVTASEDDVKETEKWIAELKTDFSGASDIESFVNLNSDEKYAVRYQKRGEVSGDLADFAFANDEGATYGPYREGNFWNMAKIVEYKNIADSVHVRHILIGANNQNEIASAYQFADSLRNGIESKKLKFDVVAKEQSTDPGSAQKGGDLGWFTQGRMVAQFNDAAFFGDASKLQVVATQYGVHIIEVLKRSKTSEYVNIALIKREIEASTDTYQNIFREASKFAAENRDAESFNAAVKEASLQVKKIILNPSLASLNNLKNSRQIVRAAFNNSKRGECVADDQGSTIFELDDRFVIALVSNAQDATDDPEFESVRYRVRGAAMNEKKAEILKEQMSGSLESIASAQGVKIQKAEGVKFDAYSIAGIGNEPAVIGAAASIEVGETSKPVMGRKGVYVVKLIAKAGDVSVNEEQGRMRLVMANQQRANSQLMEALNDISNVKDERIKFY